MGGGSFDVGSYSSRVAHQTATGFDPFAGNHSLNENLDPKKIDSLGRKIRESADSAEHPATTPIAIFFDETGSMGGIPRVLQKKLGELEGTVLRRGYVEHPQILFGAIGDAHMGEKAPLQVGQFESDNRLVETLESIYLEGQGGGNNGETYGLALYFMGKYAELDSLKKRGKKGYLFLVGDENPLPEITKREIKDYIDDDVESDYTIEQVVAQAQDKFEVYVLHIKTGSAEYQNSLKTWQDLLGFNVVSLEDPEAVCETIALIIGQNEGAIDSIDEGISHLIAAGASAKTAKAAGEALAKVGVKGGTAVAVASGGDLPDAGVFDGGTTRL